MINKGLLGIAKNLNISEKNTPPVIDTNENLLPTSQAAGQITPLHQESSASDNFSQESTPIDISASNRINSKLVSFSKWKDEVKSKVELEKQKTQKNEQNLMSFSNWKGQSEERYEGLKKIAQVAFPDQLKQKQDEAEEVLYEELLDLLPVDEAVGDSNAQDVIEELAASMVEGVERETDTLVEEYEGVAFKTLSTDKRSFFETIQQDNAISERKRIIVPRKKRRIFYDVLLVSLCVTACAISLNAFYESLNRSLTKVNEEPIATITFKYKSAQRKLSDRVLWDRVKQNTPIYNGDIIRTADFSEATITFTDGNIINLYEQSLAQVFYDDSGAAVDFSTGGISISTADTGDGLRLTNSGNEIIIDAGAEIIASVQSSIVDGKLVADNAAPITLQLTSGNASLVSPDSEEGLSLEAGSALVVSSSGLDMGSPLVSVFSPNPNAKYLRKLGETVSVVFNWAVPPDSSDAYTFELSNQKDFSLLAQQMDVTNLRTLTLDIEDGMWYWRLYTQLPEDGVVGKLRIIDSKLPQTIVPTQGEAYSYDMRPPSIRFMWTEDVYATEWHLEIADNEQMKDPIISQQYTLASSIINSLSEGTWYWRVTPVYPDGIYFENTTMDIGSNISSFSISQNTESTPVELVLPLDASIIDTTDEEYFSWKFSDDADFYTLNISEKEDMSTSVLEKNVENNYVAISSDDVQIPEGNWYWAVTKTDESGKISPIGEVRSFLALEGEFKHATISPRNRDIISHNALETTRFTWENNLPYETYFQIASDEKFESLLIEEKVDENFIEGVNIPVGKWYWRIVSKSDQNEVAYSTSVKSFFVEYYLSPVIPVSPTDGSIIIVQQGSSVSFRWDEVEHAQYYEFQLFDSESAHDPVYENDKIETTSVSIDMFSMPKGAYTCALRAVLADTASGEIRKSEVTEVGFTSRTIESVQLTSPRNAILIEGVSALMNPRSVTWSSTEVVESSVFVLANNPRGLSAEAHRNGVNVLESSVKQRIENPPSTIRLPALTEGTWYWTVLAETENGYDISARQPYQIIVSEIENLPKTMLQSPAEGEVFGSEYFVNNRSITFAWDLVESADLYYFTLKNENNEILLEKTFEDTNTFNFEDLSMLDRGTFIWTIEASRRLTEGLIQEGEIAQFSFAIDLQQVISPQNKTTGDLYGL